MTEAQLVDSARPLVRRLAKRHAQWHTPTEELESIGICAVLDAARKFDGTRPWDAMAAFWARRWMLHALRSSGRWLGLTRSGDSGDSLLRLMLSETEVEKAIVDPFGTALRTVSENDPAPIVRRVANPNLCERETEVLRCLAAGMSAKEAATELGITAGTIAFHCERIYRKLDATGRHDAVRIAVATGLIECPFCVKEHIPR